MREYLESLLRGTGAFLRCDRGSALYVTNLPVRSDCWHEVARNMTEADFCLSECGRLLTITPDITWLAPFNEWALELCQESELTRLFERRTTQETCDVEIDAWLEGIKRIELHQGMGDYEKVVRQAAAVALRNQCGGALYACGLCLDLLKEGIIC